MLSFRTIVPDTLELLKRLASEPCMASMRLVGGTGRGTRKDFVDLYVLLQHYSLSEILNFYRQRYPDYSDYRALLSLTYFEDAESQEMPVMLIPDEWDHMKKTIIQAVRQYQE
ncbi:MAG: hypothetical protein KBS40_00120 [Bacteroidales bacterium]|nr:hypothetical protein [Bacteroidales bacterium]